MTRFEASVIMFMVMAIMLILLFGVISIISTLNDIKRQQKSTKDDILNEDKGLPALVDVVDKMHRNLCVEIADKMVDRIYPDKESMNKIDWDKLSKEQKDEFLKRLIMPNYDSPFQPIYTPCYTPDGICMNPHGDCINCPKRGTGGTWSTNILTKAEDAALQERFSDNKED